MKITAPRRSRIIEAFRSVQANVRTFVPVEYTDEVHAREDVRQGRLEGALIIPAAVFAPLLRGRKSPARHGGG